jgi:NarL family two-component system sensor histidine kinase YdfH
MTLLHHRSSQNDLLRWYLLLWVCLVSLWGLFEISSRAVSAAWNACSTGSGLPDMCEQLKQHLGLQGQPDIASLPAGVVTALLLRAVIIFLLLLLLYGILLWLSLSDRRKEHLVGAALVVQGALTCVMGLLVPALSVTVPVSLLLVLILETCAVFKQGRHVLVFSGCVIVVFLLTTFLAWRQGTAFRESSLTVVVALALLVIGFLFVGGFFVLYTRLAHMHTALETAYVQLEAANERIEALTLISERQRMARELHDTLAQGLAGVILQLGVIHARARERHDDAVQEPLEQILASARETLASARGAIDDLRMHPSSLVGLVEMAQEEIRRFTLTTGVPCVAELDLLSQVPQAHLEQVVGVIREGLTNVASHAHARQAWVRVSRDAQALRLEIGDDGAGFDPGLVGLRPGHYGLLGLRERAHLAGGQLAILSVPGRGTRVQLTLPEGPARDVVEKE